MKNFILIPFFALALAACTTSGSGEGSATAGASTGGGGLISVDISDVRAEIAKNVNVSLEDVPITVQLPVDVAANVCGTNVNVLTIQINANDNTCRATTTSAELEQAVRNQM